MLSTTIMFVLVLGYTVYPSYELLIAMVGVSGVVCLRFYHFTFKSLAGLVQTEIEGSADMKYLLIIRLVGISIFAIMYNSGDSVAIAMSLIMVPYIFINVLCDITVLLLKLGIISISKVDK